MQEPDIDSNAHGLLPLSKNIYTVGMSPRLRLL